MSGKKTYIMAALYALAAVFNAVTGTGVDEATISQVIEAAMVAALRHGISKT